MKVGQRIERSELERQDALSMLQSAVGEPLRSEQRMGEFLPRVLSRVDMLVIFIAIVLFIPNVSLVQDIQGIGSSVYLYWILGTVTFLVPGALVCAQLNRFIPADGGLYVWTHRALGPLWGFFAAFCAWFPGILVLISVADGIVAWLQGIGVELLGANANWLTEPVLQGIVVIGLVLLNGWLATLPLTAIMRYARGALTLFGIAIIAVGLAGVTWLVHGHSPRVPFTIQSVGVNAPNFALYGITILALLGVEVPLNLAAEVRQQSAPALFLRWGPLIVLLAYLIGTFGVMTVMPVTSANLPYSTLAAVGAVFGPAPAIGVGIVFIVFFVFTAVIYNLAFARILFVAALDHRLPASLARINRHRAPMNAVGVQTVIVLGIALFTYILGPFLLQCKGKNFPFEVYVVTQAAATLIWSISMVLMFLDLPMLLSRLHTALQQQRAQLVAPSWLLYLCCLVGGVASLLGIWTTLTSSWDTRLLSGDNWTLYVGGLTLVCLVIGLVSSAYPRLLSSLNQQTAVARENACLYSELSAAYAKLSELDLLKDAFLASAGHELRTPLTVVQGYLELLGEIEDLDVAQRRKFITKARRACDELVLLQTNIMDAVHLSIDASALHCTNIQLQAVCSAIVDLFEPLLVREERHIEVNVPASFNVWADELRLKQVLHNLLTNALRYSPRKTPLYLTAERVEGQHMVRVSVIDRGLGVPADKQEAIFERFVRLERDAQRGMRGSGLGLAISRQLVEAMRGTITVESRGIPGEGSTFMFTLPLAPESC